MNATNTGPLSFLLLVAAFLAVPIGAGAAGRAIELPSKKTGTGPHDFYNFIAQVRYDGPAEYNLWIASVGKIDIRSVEVTDGTGAKMAIAETFKRGMLIASAQAVKLTITRAKMETACAEGMIILLSSKKRQMRVVLPASEFVEALREFDRQDSYLLAEAERLRIEKLRLAAEEAKRRREAEMRETLELLHSSLIETAKDADVDRWGIAGAGSVSGQAFLKTRGGEVRLGAGNVVFIYPDTAWWRDAMTAMGRGSDLGMSMPEELAQIVGRGVRTTEADANGNFDFTALPAGNYLLETTITWTTGSEMTGGLVTRAIRLGEGEVLRAMLTR